MCDSPALQPRVRAMSGNEIEMGWSNSLENVADKAGTVDVIGSRGFIDDSALGFMCHLGPVFRLVCVDHNSRYLTPEREPPQR